MMARIALKSFSRMLRKKMNSTGWSEMVSTRLAKSPMRFLPLLRPSGPAAVQQPPLVGGDAGAARDVPEAVAQAEAHLRAPRAVVVEVVLLDVAKVAPLEGVEMHRVVHPLLQDVELHDAGDEH